MDLITAVCLTSVPSKYGHAHECENCVDPGEGECEGEVALGEHILIGKHLWHTMRNKG